MIFLLPMTFIYNEDNMHFNMTVSLTYSSPMTTDNDFYRTIFRTYLQVMRCIGEEKPVLAL